MGELRWTPQGAASGTHTDSLGRPHGVHSSLGDPLRRSGNAAGGRGRALTAGAGGARGTVFSFISRSMARYWLTTLAIVGLCVRSRRHTGFLHPGSGHSFL